MASASFCVPNQFISRTCSSTRLQPPGNFKFRVSAIASTTASSSSSSSSSLYEVLGIQMGASFQEIKTAYRRLARITHPDVASSAAEAATDEFIRVQAAYSTLSDPQKRADYDRKQLFYGTRNYTSYSRPRNWETDQCW